MIVYIHSKYYNSFNNTVFKGLINELIYSKRNYISFVVPIWFLTSLFTIEIIYYILKRYLKYNLIIVSMVIFSGYIAYAKLRTFGTAYPWSFDAPMYYIVFFAFGNLVNENRYRINIKFQYIVCYIFLLINFITLINPNIFDFLYSIKFIFPYDFLVYLSSLLITSFGIFGYIPIGFYVANKLIKFLSFGITFKYNIYGICYSIISILILIPFIFLINNFTPFLAGKKYHSGCQPL